MKKIPIILSGMALLSGHTGALTEMVPTWAAIGENTSLIQQTLGEDLATSSYEHFSHFKLDFDFGNDWLGVETDTPMNEGDRLSWVTVVYRDVDQGITEAEADMKATTLANADPDWAVVLQSQSVNPRSEGFALSLRQSATFDMNPTDITYYAAQFTNQVTGDTYWLRGKLDYRRCRHSAAFGQESDTCVAVVNEAAQQVDYAVYNSGRLEVSSEDDILLTWEEEWTQYLEKRVAALNQRLMELEGKLAEANSQLSDIRGELLEKDDLLAGKDAEISGLRAEVSGLRAEIERLQQGGSDLATDDLEAENRELRVQVQKLTEELHGVQMRAEDQRQQFEAQRTELEQRLVAQEVEFARRLQEKEAELNAQMQAERVEFNKQMQAKEAELAQARAKIIEVQSMNNDQATNCEQGVSINPGVNDDQNLDNVTTILDMSNGGNVGSTEDNVEIPKLGEETTVDLNIWWILAGVVGCFGAALFWLKRSFQRK